jgi:hypothetical protein
MKVWVETIDGETFQCGPPPLNWDEAYERAEKIATVGAIIEKGEAFEFYPACRIARVVYAEEAPQRGRRLVVG